jgi:hypothetical protein
MGVWDDAEADGCMTAAAILEVCKKKHADGLYRTPELNDRLYLHFKGWRNIAGLEEYTNVRCLWLEGNAIAKIEGLDPLARSLRTLYLHQNCIQNMDGLDRLVQLDNINLSDNFIGRIGGLAGCVSLRTLTLKGNKLRDVEDVAHLARCPSITVLDLSENQLQDGSIVDVVLARMPNLAVLKLEGNPCIREIPHYRKTLVSKLEKLRYLDDRPVTDDERRTAEAWARGGLAEERREREQLRTEADAKRLADLRAFDELVANNHRTRDENDRRGIPTSPTEYVRMNHGPPPMIAQLPASVLTGAEGDHDLHRHGSPVSITIEEADSDDQSDIDTVVIDNTCPTDGYRVPDDRRAKRAWASEEPHDLMIADVPPPHSQNEPSSEFPDLHSHDE